MIGLLDPTLFDARPKAEAEVVRDLEFVLRACRDHNIELTPLREYWPALWKELGSTLERQLSPQAKRTLQAVRSVAPSPDAHIASLSANAGVVWRRGFTVLFKPPWTDRMALAVIRAVSYSTSVVMFCRRVEGRNLVIHAAGNSTLHENTRWVLHVQPSGAGPRQVLCVHHPRNLRERWTSRFDWRLPTASDCARYPFCVPNQWWRGSTIAFRTVSSNATASTTSGASRLWASEGRERLHDGAAQLCHGRLDGVRQCHERHGLSRVDEPRAPLLGKRRRGPRWIQRIREHSPRRLSGVHRLAPSKRRDPSRLRQSSLNRSAAAYVLPVTCSRYLAIYLSLSRHRPPCSSDRIDPRAQARFFRRAPSQGAPAES